MTCSLQRDLTTVHHLHIYRSSASPPVLLEVFILVFDH